MKRIKISMLVMLSMLVLSSIALAEKKQIQSKCPIMGNAITKELYVDYKGSRVFFCCKGCIPAFNKDPDKFISRMEKKGIELASTPAKKDNSCPDSVCKIVKTSGCGTGGCGAAAKAKKGGCSSQVKKSCCEICEANKAKCGAGAKKCDSELTIINTKTLATLIKAKTDMVILDARSGKYDDGKRIPGAKSLAPNASEKEAKNVIGNKDTLIVAYCSNPKCPASAKLAKNLMKMGYTNILKYKAGIAAWIKAGHKVNKVK